MVDSTSRSFGFRETKVMIWKLELGYESRITVQLTGWLKKAVAAATGSEYSTAEDVAHIKHKD